MLYPFATVNADLIRQAHRQRLHAQSLKDPHGRAMRAAALAMARRCLLMARWYRQRRAIYMQADQLRGQAAACAAHQPLIANHMRWKADLLDHRADVLPHPLR
jgi:hypothetical protein